MVLGIGKLGGKVRWIGCEDAKMRRCEDLEKVSEGRKMKDER